jgi:hypothetical protein
MIGSPHALDAKFSDRGPRSEMRAAAICVWKPIGFPIYVAELPQDFQSRRDTDGTYYSIGRGRLR